MKTKPIIIPITYCMSQKLGQNCHRTMIITKIWPRNWQRLAHKITKTVLGHGATQIDLTDTVWKQLDWNIGNTKWLGRYRTVLVSKRKSQRDHDSPGNANGIHAQFYKRKPMNQGLGWSCLHRKSRRYQKRSRSCLCVRYRYLLDLISLSKLIFSFGR